MSEGPVDPGPHPPRRVVEYGGTSGGAAALVVGVALFVLGGAIVRPRK